MPILETRNLTKRFGGLTAVGDVSFAVEPGEIFGIIGPNGAGKTTVFSVLVGAIPATSGEVLFKGTSTRGLAPHAMAQRGLCRTHQIVRPFRESTVLDNVRVGASFGSRQLRGAAAGTRAEELLAFVGLSHRTATLAGSLSIGELKRLEIARALAAEPDVICLDEVMGGLNPAEINQAMDLVRRIRSLGKTVLMIEHHIRAVTGLSDRILVLNFGRKLAEDVPERVVRNPAVIEAYLGKAAGN